MRLALSGVNATVNTYWRPRSHSAPSPAKSPAPCLPRADACPRMHRCPEPLPTRTGSARAPRRWGPGGANTRAAAATLSASLSRRLRSRKYQATSGCSGPPCHGAACRSTRLPAVSSISTRARAPFAAPFQPLRSAGSLNAGRPPRGAGRSRPAGFPSAEWQSRRRRRSPNESPVRPRSRGR